MTKPTKPRRPKAEATKLQAQATRRRTLRHKDLQALKNLIKDCRAQTKDISDEATFLDLC